MARRVVITGLGPVSGLGIGIEPVWNGLREGRCSIATITSFDPSGFACTIAAEVRDFKVNSFVPKSYRKAVKVMARDIELAVAAADLAARDAKLNTKGTIAEGTQTPTTYPPQRVGAHIGAGLIACELNELTDALDKARQDADSTKFDIHKWGTDGMQQLTPLWLLKYLPNMLACHVTIIHDAQGPSNTITCAEASSGLSIGESLRVIQRGAADASFCGGTESKLNPMAFLRQVISNRLNTTSNHDPAHALRPFAPDAAGTVVGEGGAIIILEAEETFKARAATTGARAYAAIKGFGASQSVHPESRNFLPDPQGKGIALAVKNAIRDAGLTPDDIDLIIPCGCGIKASDASEMAAYRTVFGTRLDSIPIQSVKPLLGNCGAGTGGIDVAIAAKAVEQQQLPIGPAKTTSIRNILTISVSLGGQNAALVVGKL